MNSKQLSKKVNQSTKQVKLEKLYKKKIYKAATFDKSVNVILSFLFPDSSRTVSS